MRRWEAGALFETRTWHRHKLHRLTQLTRGGSGGSPLARIAAVVLVVAAIAVVAVLLFAGGGSGYTVYATFENAGQLVKGNQVQVGGRPIGTITEIELTDDGRARVEMKLDDYAPLHEGTRATIRVELAVGHRRPLHLARPRPEQRGRDRGRRRDHRRPDDRAGRPRPALQHARRGHPQGPPGHHQGLRRRSIDGRCRRRNESLEYFNPALSTTSALTREIVSRQGDVRALRHRARRRSAAIAERRDDLTDLVGNANTTAARHRRRERRARARARPPAAHAAQGEHHLRQPARRRSTTSTRSSTSRSRPPRTSRRSCARCARS